MPSFTLTLKGMPTGKVAYAWSLDEEWFARIDGPQVKKGEVEVKLTVNHTGPSFELNFSFEGNVTVTCDRCLEDMTLPVSTESRLFVKLGAEYREESDELVVIPEDKGQLDVSWYLYETIALSIPIRHVHEDGKCSGTTFSELKKHLARSKGDEEDETFPLDDATDEGTVGEEETPINPIWEKLKQLKDKDNN